MTQACKLALPVKQKHAQTFMRRQPPAPNTQTHTQTHISVLAQRTKPLETLFSLSGRRAYFMVQAKPSDGKTLLTVNDYLVWAGASVCRTNLECTLKGIKITLLGGV